MNDIIINKISKKFDAQTVFSDYSAVILAGKIHHLTGPSGTGKTTLLRMLMKLEMPDLGTISGIPANIGAVFQENRLIEDLSVAENISLVIPGRADRGIIESHLNKIGLEDCIDKKVSELSGGMKRRVSIVRAVLYPCELLLFDEPFTGLDDKAIEITSGYILSELKGRTCVVASHISDSKLLKDPVVIPVQC
ncbi:MAG: ATP-binding cassette domain-containing protein [Eubacteriales bacterium]|nr:ATP-binding cassette domain-containing protein [Eubacteriales bacterium]